MKRSPSLQAFLDNLDAGGSQATTTYDLAALARLEGVEREFAELSLIELVHAKDLRAIESVGRARIDGALPYLRILMKHDDGDVGAHAARAILLIVGTDDVAVARVAEGVTSSSMMASAMSAYTLRFQDGPEAVRGLLDALTSTSSSTRANAMFGLREKLGLENLVTPRQSPLFAQEMRAMSRLQSVWRPAASRIRTWIEALIAGKTPEELGLVYVPSGQDEAVDSFWQSVDRSETPVDHDAFSRLRGHDREWAVSYLLQEFWMKPELAADLATLGLVEAIPALQEALAKGTNRRKPHYAAALDVLAPS